MGFSRKRGVGGTTKKVSFYARKKNKGCSIASKKVVKETLKKARSVAFAESTIEQTKEVKKKNMIDKKKTEEKTEIKKDRLQELKKMFLKRREEILKEAKDEINRYISGENRQFIDTAIDDGDWATVDISEDINLRRLTVHRKMLHDIEVALQKISEGTYGICEECGEEISEKRLAVLPTASLCVDCKENLERLEEISSEEEL